MKKRCRTMVLPIILLGISLSVYPLNCAAQSVNDTEVNTKEKEEETENSYTESIQNREAIQPTKSKGLFDNYPSYLVSPYALPNPPIEGLVLRTIFNEPIKGTTTTDPPLFISNRILQITADKKSQLGAIWSKSKLDLTKNFNIQSYIYLGDRGKGAGDGITFTLQNDSRMSTTSKNQVIGTDGAGIGAYSKNKATDTYIRNALSLEFDTYHNSGTTDKMDGDIDKNGSRGHIAFTTPSSTNNNKGQHTNVKYPSEFLSSGTWRKLDISWDAGLKKLSYSLDGVASSEIIISNLNQQFGGTEVYWGFTGSTGGSFAQNVITVTELPQDLHQSGTIKNETTETEFATSVDGTKEDVVVLKDSISIERLDNRDFSSSKVQLHLDNGLSYQENSIKVNGNPVDSNQVSVNGQVITITDVDFSDRGKAIEIQVSAKVNTASQGSRLSSYFDFIDLEGEILSESNLIYLNVTAPRKGTVTINWMKGQTKIKPTETKEGSIGEPYDFESLKEQDTYVWLRTEGDISGTYQKGNKELTFYYEDGIVQLTAWPKKIDFGQQKVTTTTQEYWANLDGKLAVTDNRGSKKSMWRVTASEEEPLKNKSTLLSGGIHFVKDHTKEPITTSKTIIKEMKQTTDGEYVITDQWNDGETGLRVEIPVGKQKIGQYKGVISWNLENVPSNEGGM